MPLNNSGFSITGTLIAMGAMGVIALSSLALFDTNLKQQKFVEQKYAATNTHMEIFQHLSNTQACTTTFTAAGQVLTLDLIDSPPTEEFAFLAIKSDSGADAYKKYVSAGDPVYQGNLVKIDDLRVINYTDQGLDNNNRYTGTAHLQIRYRQGSRTIGPEVFYPRFMKVHFTFKRTDTTAPAGPDTSNDREVFACKAYGGAGDSFWSLAASGEGIYYGDNVGIGTSTPDRSLHVQSRSGTGAHSATVNIVRGREGADINDMAAGLRFEVLNSLGQRFYAGNVFGGIEDIGQAQKEGFLAFYTKRGPDNNNGSNSTEKVRITSNGNVGIGVTAPTNKLEIAGGIKLGSQGQTGVCNSGSEGVVRYNTLMKIMEYCDGDGTWHSSTPSIKIVRKHCNCGNPGFGSGSPDCQSCIEIGSTNDWVSMTHVDCPAGYTALAANGQASGTQEAVSFDIQDANSVRCKSQSWGSSGTMSTFCTAICIRGSVRID